MSEITQQKHSSNTCLKREVVSKQKNQMTTNSKNVRKVKIEPIIRSSYKMTDQLMTSNENNIDDCKIHMKQCLNELKPSTF